MHIHCLGLNHQTAAVGLRERMILTDEEAREVVRCLSSDDGSWSGDLAEVASLSTCNRVELYALSSDSGTDALLAMLAEMHGISPEEFERHCYQYVDQEAVRHLFRVASGLDSLVLGEPQILGQVAHALEIAQSRGTSGPVLVRLFQAAVHTGKRARSETQISRNPASISSLAATLAEQNSPQMDRKQIVVIGAGEMAELAVEALHKRGARHILVVNRTREHAVQLAANWDAQVTTFDHLEEALTLADILITSTSAPHTFIHRPQVERIMQVRPERSLVAIDIAVPRDIDPDVGNIPGVRLYDIDSLNQQLEQSLARRMKEVPHVEAIIAEEEARFQEYFQSLDMLPLITNLRGRAETIRKSELEKTLRRLPDLTQVERERIDALTQALVKKLIDAPITRLRAEARCPHSPRYALVVRSLYGLEEQGHLCAFSDGPCPLNSSLTPSVP